MDKPPAPDTKYHRRPITEPASSSPLLLPNPYVSNRNPRGDQFSPGPRVERKGDALWSHGYNDTRRPRETGDDFSQRSRSMRDSQAKASKSSLESSHQGRYVDKNMVNAQKRGFRGARSAQSSPGTPTLEQPSLVPFEVKVADFPELSGVSLCTSVVQKECWGPTPPSVTPKPSASAWKSGRKASPTKPEPQQSCTTLKPDPPRVIPSGQPVVTSWANVASQPPKKVVPQEKTIGSNCVQTEEVAADQKEGATGKKRRKKKNKKAKSAEEDADVKSEELATYQEPPKFEDEEEFPGLTPALTQSEGWISSRNSAKLCNEENQRAGGQHLSADQNKDRSTALKMLSTEAAKKGQKTEKVSGKKSKVPVQLDIGNMLATLEKKQHSQKAKQDAKPIVLSVGGGLPVIQKQPPVQRKLPWQQDKIAHNPLDSTSPLVKKGKQREVPKAKKPTPLKKVILKEREERKQKRLLEERGLLPENEEVKPAEDHQAEEEPCDTDDTGQRKTIESCDEVGSSTEELEPSELNEPKQSAAKEEEEEEEEKEEQEAADKEERVEQTTLPAPCPLSRPKIHSRKFRDYCSQMLSRDVDQCVTTLLKELVRFQDRLYQKDPMKARMKRRLVMGLREVLKHLKLRKVKCVVISPNCERIQSKGGLDEALHNIIDMCREQGIPFVFALSRKALGRCVNKAVPVSLVGIFNYDGAQDHYHKMIELTSEARTAYDVMVTSLDQEDPDLAEEEEEPQLSSLPVGAEPSAEVTLPEEQEYIKIWKKMLEKEYNHAFLNFEEQLGSLCLDDGECTENTEDVKS